MITPEEVYKSIVSGMNVVCSFCEHYYEARDKFGEGSDCGVTKCGGPMVGRNFPEYKGPLDRSKFKSICLCCGSSDISYFILIKGEKSFGICNTHVDMFYKAFSGIKSVANKPIIVPIQSDKFDV